MQLFVRGLSGRSMVVEVPHDAHGSYLTAQVQELLGVPANALVLLSASRVIHEAEPLHTQGVTPDSTVHVTSRLIGGKGGFGALLRGQGRDGNITTNFDACRDLSGRRIRQQTADEKLRKWQEQAKERELEQLALKHVKEQAKKERQEQQALVDVDAVRSEQQQAVAQVQDAVQAALAEATKACSSSARDFDEDGAAGAAAFAGTTLGSKGGSKHKLAAPAAKTNKKPRMLAMLEGGLTDDDDDSCSDAED